MVEAGARARPLEAGDLSPDFEAQLVRVCASDPLVDAVWLLLITWPDGPDEIAASVRLTQRDPEALHDFAARVDALGGPRCVVGLASGQPTMAPFYARTPAA